MSDDIHFNYIYTLVEAWFYTEDKARRWYTSEIIPSFHMTPAQIVEQRGRDAPENLNEAKNLGSFEQRLVRFKSHWKFSKFTSSM